ncbi:MAG: HEAT repeat domain-containing protein [Planctomycetes bacterium]|nr:HEAT repeat domain-containing protein [Planctomycetota bacterium]
MRPLTFSLALLMLLALQGMAVADDAQNAKLEELWKTGSLWQVGDNIPKVEAARKEIVAAGDAGLAFAFTKLGSSDGLEYRCIEAVFKGFGAKALPGLLERMGHKDVKVRRNVAAMFGVIDDKSAAPKMVEHLKKESDLRCKVGHLQTLARWKEPTALDPLIECTRVTQEQEPLAERLKVRIVPLLANYEDEKAISRLIELLDDEAYFIRDAARDALKSSRKGHNACAKEAALVLPKCTQNEVPRLCLLLSACTGFGALTEYELFVSALDSSQERIRARAVRCLIQWLDAYYEMIEENRKNGIRDDLYKDERGSLMTGVKQSTFRIVHMRAFESDPLVLDAIDDAEIGLAALEGKLK